MAVTGLTLSKNMVVETRMPVDGNNCLLHALLYRDAANGSQASKRQLKMMRDTLATAIIEQRHTVVNGVPLETWVTETSDTNFGAWIVAFRSAGAMADQIVLHFWPIVHREQVWVWQLSSAGDRYERCFCFGDPSLEEERAAAASNLALPISPCTHRQLPNPSP